MNKLHVGLGFPSQHQFVGSTAPPTDADKDDCKCGKGCLSKNSIANAASVVSPAVVNITISQGLQFAHTFFCTRLSNTDELNLCFRRFWKGHWVRHNC